MRVMSAIVIAGLAVLSFAPQAIAASCYDLWYARNAIYDDNGFCFKTDLGQQTFDNSDCWTSHPHFSRSEQRRIDAIRAEERRRGCHVN